MPSKLKNYLSGTQLYIALCDKINEMGFPAEEIISIIREHHDTTYITGSFLLNYINNDNHWSPNDIDIFTSEPQVFHKLHTVVKDVTTPLGSLGASSAQYNNVYNQQIGGILDIYEWQSKTNTNKKLQIILNDESTDEAIDNFDFEFAKCKFNGYEIIMNFKTKKSVRNKTSILPSEYQTMSKFSNTCKRVNKYNKRGYTLKYPIEVSIEYVGGSPEYNVIVMTNELKNFPILNSIYKVSENRKLVRK